MDVENPERYEDEKPPLDTGSPPGVHPNSEDPDPEVVEEAKERAEDDARTEPDSAAAD